MIAGLLVTVCLAGPPAQHTYQPRPRQLAPPTVLATGLSDATQLFRDGAAWLVVRNDSLLRVDPAASATAHEVVRADLPPGVVLLRHDGEFYGVLPGMLARFDTNKVESLAFDRPGLRAVTAASAHLYWLEDQPDKAEQSPSDARLFRVPTAGSAVELIAEGLGPHDRLMVRDTDYLLGWSGDEPRGLFRLDPATGATTRLGTSRFHTREFVQVGGTLYLLMAEGHGFVHRFDPEQPPDSSLRPIALAQSSPKALQEDGGALYWAASSYIARVALPDGVLEVLAVDTRPSDLVVHQGEVTWIDRYRGQLLRLVASP